MISPVHDLISISVSQHCCDPSPSNSPLQAAGAGAGATNSAGRAAEDVVVVVLAQAAVSTTKQKSMVKPAMDDCGVLEEGGAMDAAKSWFSL
jgi:hypothetical protein